MKIILFILLGVALLALLFFGGMVLFYILRYAVCDTIDLLFYDLWGRHPFSRYCSRGEGYGWQWDEHGNCIGFDPKSVR